MDDEVEIPGYPGCALISRRHADDFEGGGGVMENYASTDHPDDVAAFYEQRLGPADRVTKPGVAIWKFEKPNGGDRLEVWPADGDYPCRKGASPPSEESPVQTVIHHSSFYRVSKPDPSRDTLREKFPEYAAALDAERRRKRWIVIVLLIGVTLAVIWLLQT